MKALSVRAPWWWAILHGKPVENRSWSTAFRGRIWIHASKWWNLDEVSDDFYEIKRMAGEDQLSMPFPDADENEPFGMAMRLACGCIVGTVEIVDCVTAHPSAFFVGRYGFVLRNPVAIEKPWPAKGALGFFEAVPAVVAPSLF